MITSIHIRNFQSHVDTKIDFAPNGRLTVIIGPTDSGKTAAFRALRWVAYNEPTGTDFIRAGATGAKVTITLADGRTVIRERSKSANRYTITWGPGLDGLTLEGFGVGVPLEVQDALGIRPVAVGDQEFNLNLAEQLDGPFLGRSVPATQKAKVLGKLAGTEEVDFASKRLGTDLYRRRRDEQAAAAEIERVEGQLGGYEYLEDLGHAIKKVTALLDEAKTAGVKSTRLEQLQTALVDASDRIQAFDKRIHTLRMVLAFTGPLEAQTARALERRDNVTGLAARLDTVKHGLADARATLQKTAEADQVNRLFAGTAKDIERADSLHRLGERVRTVEQGITAADRMLQTTAPADRGARSLAGAAADIERIGRLRGLGDKLIAINTAARHQHKTLARLAGLAGAQDLTHETTRRASRLSTLREYGEALDGIDHSRYLGEETVSHLSREIGCAQDEYGVVLTEAGRCPTCGAATTEMQLKEVV